MTDSEEFKVYLNHLSDPNYPGGSWSLPKKATSLERSKYEFCREILLYQQEHELTDDKLSERMELTLAETEDILYYRISHFTLDRLLTYANKLFSPINLVIVKEKSQEHLSSLHV